MKDYVVHQKITLNAKPEVVWDALTNPDKTEKYFFNCRVLSDWKAGGPIIFKGKMFWVIPIEMKGEIVKITPNKLLKYTLKNGKGKDATTSTVTDELTYADGKTTLSITDDVGSGEGADKRYHRSVKGWHKILTGLKHFIADQPA
ncbi:SRPBCC domain-containing protein [Mucilaginibacter sp. AW1-3]